MTIEEYLATMPFINVIGGSPLCTTPPIGCSISINGIRDAVAAAVNCGKKDERRVKGWSRVLLPNPDHGKHPEHWMRPGQDYRGWWPDYIRHSKTIQPTTIFSLLIICEVHCALTDKETHLYGYDGWASKWHDGDFEMHWIKTKMKHVIVHDPRPHW